MMPFGIARGDQLFTNADRKPEIRKPVTVQVSKLAAPDPEFHSAEPVGCDDDAVPCRHFADDLLVDCFGHLEFG
jgi:hypothetical protein